MRQQKRKGTKRLQVTRVHILFACIILSFGIMLFGGVRASAGQPQRPKYYTSISVKQGDSLWSIAEKYAPDYGNIQAYIEEIMQINHLLNADALKAGQSLIVVYY